METRCHHHDRQAAPRSWLRRLRAALLDELMVDDRRPSQPQYLPGLGNDQEPAERRPAEDSQRHDNRTVLAQLVALNAVIGRRARVIRDPRTLTAAALAGVVALGTVTWLGNHPSDDSAVPAPAVTPTIGHTDGRQPAPTPPRTHPPLPTQPPTGHLRTNQDTAKPHAATTRRGHEVLGDRMVVRDGPAHTHSTTTYQRPVNPRNTSRTQQGSGDADRASEPTRQGSSSDDDAAGAPGSEPTSTEPSTEPTHAQPTTQSSSGDDGDNGEAGAVGQPPQQRQEDDCLLEVDVNPLLDVGLLC